MQKPIPSSLGNPQLFVTLENIFLALDRFDCR